MNEKTTAILAKIREVCPELEYDSGEPVGSGYIKYHTVHLEHLLRAIRDTSDGYYKLGSFLDWLYVTNVRDDFGDRPTHFTQHFKLDLSIQENLESDESLRDFLYELICTP